jgi:Txe/YoeB family toxin of Txe-Axe toxin-antitoxin module
VQKRALAAFRQFERNPFHPGLRFKEVSHQDGWWSARISDSHRALGVRDRDDIVWFWIGTHAEYDQLLRSR